VIGSWNVSGVHSMAKSECAFRRKNNGCAAAAGCPLLCPGSPPPPPPHPPLECVPRCDPAYFLLFFSTLRGRLFWLYPASSEGVSQ
jgi:hypothetical protein